MCIPYSLSSVLSWKPRPAATLHIGKEDFRLVGVPGPSGHVGGLDGYQFQILVLPSGYHVVGQDLHPLEIAGPDDDLPVIGDVLEIPDGLLGVIGLDPYQGVILSIYFFHLFPDKKIGRFSTVFACPYFTVTARGCQSLVPCFSLISWSCTRILFFLSTTALGCAFNVLLHACTVAPNAVTAFIIRCHRSHVNPFTRPKNDFFV